MKYWQYRGYNGNYQIKYGVETAATFELLALHLRQRGIALIEAQSISKSQYYSMLKTYPKDVTPISMPPKMPWWAKMISWFLRDA